MVLQTCVLNAGLHFGCQPDAYLADVFWEEMRLEALQATQPRSLARNEEARLGGAPGEKRGPPRAAGAITGTEARGPTGVVPVPTGSGRLLRPRTRG